MGIKKKAAMHIIESIIAFLLLFTFVIFSFPKATPEEDSLLEKKVAYETIKTTALSGVLDEAFLTRNVSKFEEILSKLLPTIELKTGVETIEVATFIIKDSTNISITVNKSEVTDAFVDLFTPELQQIDISVNSVSVFSSSTKKELGIRIYQYLQTGENRIEISKSGEKEVYVVIRLISTNIPPLPENEKIIVITFPYFLKEVNILYVYIL
jgi:hypothetical protein